MQQVVLGESVRVILEHAQSHNVITTNLEFDKFEIIRKIAPSDHLS